ncbi:MAG: hypothetical protein F4Z04_16275 [Acidobacteria bacterium]|nr:hypothetical protein [Acidobacteriota bacterium]
MTPSGPWSAFAPAVHTTCEPAVAGWIAHPADTVSALAYLLAAILARRLAPAIAARVALVGVMAVGFHATGTDFMQRLDLAAVILLNGHLLVWALIRSGHGAAERRRAMEVAIAAIPAVAGFLFSWLGYVIGAVEALTALALWQRLTRTTPAVRHDVRWIAGLVLPGSILLGLGHLGIGCVTGAAAHIVQPHVIWHVASAIACMIICRMDRTLRQSTTLPPPTR